MYEPMTTTPALEEIARVATPHHHIYAVVWRGITQGYYLVEKRTIPNPGGVSPQVYHWSAPEDRRYRVLSRQAGANRLNFERHTADISVLRIKLPR